MSNLVPKNNSNNEPWHTDGRSDNSSEERDKKSSIYAKSTRKHRVSRPGESYLIIVHSNGEIHAEDLEIKTVGGVTHFISPKDGSDIATMTVDDLGKYVLKSSGGSEIDPLYDSGVYSVVGVATASGRQAIQNVFEVHGDDWDASSSIH
jgi:hypothetical protein